MTTRLPTWIALGFAVVLVACGDTQSDPQPIPGNAPPATITNTTPTPTADGITMTTATKQRLSGVYFDVKDAITIKFDLAKVGDDVFADITGNGGRPIVRLETNCDDYNFSYLGGRLTLHTTKSFIATAKEKTPADGVSTDNFAFAGDMHALDDMLALPEVAHLPFLSRALGVRGFTGSDYPASLVLHKMGRQSADALGITLQKLDTPASANGYCDAYPNSWDSCYGMCGPGCSCWSWVCGDCCYHYGCAVHDSWCRQGKWWYCYNITAVIALFGC